MNDKQRVHVSKYLSRHLRHAPEDLGLALLPGGWVYIEDLLAGAREDDFPITREELREVVQQSDKQRFALDEERGLIRANQGHSVEVDLQLEPESPPEILYHGTPREALEAIFATGLQRMSRHHVHLSAEVATAIKVGQRRGKPVVLAVAAGRLHAAGGKFYRSVNNVWLVDEVPPEYLSLLEESPSQPS